MGRLVGLHHDIARNVAPARSACCLCQKLKGTLSTVKIAGIER